VKTKAHLLGQVGSPKKIAPQRRKAPVPSHVPPRLMRRQPSSPEDMDLMMRSINSVWALV
jgi:hypothetical protein